MLSCLLHSWIQQLLVVKFLKFIQLRTQTLTKKGANIDDVVVSKQLRQYYIECKFNRLKAPCQFVTMKETKLAVELLAQ